MQKSVRVKSFELFAQNIADVDVDFLHALTASVSWPHRAADIEFLRSVGCGIAVVDGIGRVFGTAMWFPQDAALATVGLVITTPRAQANGTGRWMMAQVMERTAGYDLILNSTRPAYPLYASLGFAREATVNMRQGTIASDIPLPSGTASCTPDDLDQALPEIAAFDAKAFGANRLAMLQALSVGAVVKTLHRGGRLAGYAMRRSFGRGEVIGPIAACNDADAIDLVASNFKEMRGQFVRIDTREARGQFADFLGGCGMTIAETAVTMSKGRKALLYLPGGPRIYGLAGHALN